MGASVQISPGDTAYPRAPDPTRGVAGWCVGRRRRRRESRLPHDRGVVPAMDVSFLHPVFAAPASTPRSTPAVAVLPRAAMPDGAPVAAVLRYTDASTTS